MDLGLEDRTALVCGASAGLGKAIARALSREGAAVAICSRSQERVDAAAGEITGETGGRVVALEANLTDPDDVRAVVAGATEALGRLDILVTNTGGPPAGPFESHDAETWDHAIRQNFTSVVNLVRAALPGMKERRWGRIVNVTSISVKQPVGGLILSNSLRAGVTGFAKTISNEAGPHNVTVNCVLPGYTRTERLDELAASQSAGDETRTPEDVFRAWEDQVPMARLAEPEELADLTAFLCSERAGYITGQSIAVDGGWIRGLI